MKKSKWFPALLLVITGISLVTSCKKDEDTGGNNNNNNTPAPTENKITAKVDGADWIADASTISGLYITAVTTKSLVINGTHADGSFFTLSINLWNDQTGTFQTSTTSTSNFVALTYEDANSESYSAPVNGVSAASGELVIDYWQDNKVSGSFSFTGGQQGNSTTVSVTDGTFSCINVQ